MTTRTLRSLWACLSVATLLVASPSTNAATVIYGNYSGSAIDYLAVQESSATDPVPLYGTPTVVGNVIDFSPGGFASSANGGASDSTDGQLDMTIRAKPSYAVDRMVFSEAGDYTLIGAGSASTFAQVTASFSLEILEVDGVNLAIPVSFSSAMLFSPNAAGVFSLPLNMGVGKKWDGSVAMDLGQALDDAEIAYNLGATLVRVSLDNRLATQSASGTSSFIAKKDFKGFSVTTFVVPEPSSFALLLLGGLGLLIRRNR